MAEKLGIYKCNVCGNVVQTLINGNGELVCCGQNMKLLSPKSDNNELGEKHEVNVFYEDNRRFAVVKNHPMTEEHYIQFIEAIDNDRNEIHLKFFKPTEIPEFEITNYSENLVLQELCNIHELWGKSRGDKND